MALLLPSRRGARKPNATALADFGRAPTPPVAYKVPAAEAARQVPPVSPPAERGMLKTTLLLVPAHVVARVGEALWPLALASWFGRSAATDAFNLGWSFFAFVGSLVFGAFQDSALVSLVVETRLRRPQQLGALVGGLLLYTAAAGALLALVFTGAGLVFFDAVYASGTAAFMKSMAPYFGLYLVLLGVRTYLVAVLNADNRFQLAPVGSAIALLAAAAFVWAARGRFGVVSVPMGTALGEALHVAFLFFALKRGATYTLELTWKLPGRVWPILRQVLAAAGGGSVTRVNPIVDQHMATLFAVGGATMLRYSNDIATIPTSLLQAVFLPVLTSRLATAFSEKDERAFRSVTRRGELGSMAVLTAAALLLFLVRRPLLRFVLLRGEMDAEAVDRIASLVGYHLVGLPAFGLLLVQVRAFVCVGLSRVLLPMGFVNAALNLVFNLVLARWLGLEGIALATSAMNTSIALILFVILRRRLRGFEQLASVVDEPDEAAA